MICRSILGNIKATDTARHFEKIPLYLEWYELPKRIMRKKLPTGEGFSIKFMRQNRVPLQEGDILFKDENRIVFATVKPCDAIEIAPKNLYEMGAVCYEIGNKHLPVFLLENKILVPYEEPLLHQLGKAGYHVEKTHCKLLNPLKTTVQPHETSLSFFK